MAAQRSIPMLSPEEASELCGKGPVSALPYRDADWWADEQAAIFRRSWLQIGHVCEVPQPGSFIRRDIEFAAASLLIVRGKDGAVRAFHNVCTHRGTQLVEEEQGKKAQFSCPYHMWTFGTDGSLLSAPDFERFDLTKADCALKTVHCEVVAGMIFVNLCPERPRETAREFYGNIADELDTLPVARATHFTEWTYEIAANWKTHFDNFQENYHLRFVHARTAAAGFGGENPFGYPTHYGFLGPHRSQRLWRNPNPPPIANTQLKGYKIRAAADAAPPFPKMDFKLFPALHIVALPPGVIYTHTHWPLGPDRTRSIVRLYWTGEAANASEAFARELAAMTIRDVLSEDRDMVENAQRGLSGGAVAQVHFQPHEILLRHQYETVTKMVGDYRAETLRREREISPSPSGEGEGVGAVSARKPESLRQNTPPTPAPPLKGRGSSLRENRQ